MAQPQQQQQYPPPYNTVQDLESAPAPRPDNNARPKFRLPKYPKKSPERNIIDSEIGKAVLSAITVVLAALILARAERQSGQNVLLILIGASLCIAASGITFFLSAYTYLIPAPLTKHSRICIAISTIIWLATFPIMFAGAASPGASILNTRDIIPPTLWTRRVRYVYLDIDQLGWAAGAFAAGCFVTCLSQWWFDFRAKSYYAEHSAKQRRRSSGNRVTAVTGEPQQTTQSQSQTYQTESGWENNQNGAVYGQTGYQNGGVGNDPAIVR